MKATVSILRIRGRERKAPKIYTGDLAFDAKTATAHLFCGETLEASMTRATLAQISADGLLLEGIEDWGQRAFHFQQWWCRPAAEEEGSF